MWALLFPNNKSAKERQAECIKLAVCETSIKVLAGGKPEEMTPALGILSTLGGNLDQARQVSHSRTINVLQRVAPQSASVHVLCLHISPILNTGTGIPIANSVLNYLAIKLFDPQIILDNKPSALPHMLKAFSSDSATVKASASCERSIYL